MIVERLVAQVDETEVTSRRERRRQPREQARCTNTPRGPLRRNHVEERLGQRADQLVRAVEGRDSPSARHEWPEALRDVAARIELVRAVAAVVTPNEV